MRKMKNMKNKKTIWVVTRVTDKYGREYFSENGNWTSEKDEAKNIGKWDPYGPFLPPHLDDSGAKYTLIYRADKM